MALLTISPSMNTPTRSSPASCSANCGMAATLSRPPTLTARQATHHGTCKPNRRSTTLLAYRGGNCGDGYGGGNSWRGGPFQMNPNMMMAGAALAEIMELARKWQAANPSGPDFPQTGGNPTNGNPTDSMTQLPLPVDLQESEDHYTLTADVPGLQKSDLKITVNQRERTLTVSGERKRASNSNPNLKADNTQDQQNQQQFRRQFERRMGKFQRTLSGLPDDADLALVSARVDKGVLTISVKKTEQKRYEDFVEINIE